MKKTKIVFFDIDHTLYDPHTRCVPKSAIDAIETLAKNPDVLIGIATGRSAYMLDVIDTIKPYIDVYVTINGQIVYTNDAILYDRPLDKKTVNSIREVFEKHDLVYGCIGLNTQVINRFDDHIKEQFDEASMPLPIVNEEYFTTHAIYQMWAFADDKTAQNIANGLPKYRLVPWLSDGFDIVLHRQNKKDGIKIVLEHFNIPLENTYAFGDGDNDLEMLSYVPNSVAMGESAPHVKQAASYVTDSYRNDGIIKALRHFGLIS